MIEIRSGLFARSPNRNASENCLKGLEPTRVHPKLLSSTPVSEITCAVKEPVDPLVRKNATFERNASFDARPARTSRLPALVFEPASRSVKPGSCRPTAPVGCTFNVSPRTRSGSTFVSPVDGATSTNESPYETSSDTELPGPVIQAAGKSSQAFVSPAAIEMSCPTLDLPPQPAALHGTYEYRTLTLRGAEDGLWRTKRLRHE